MLTIIEAPSLVQVRHPEPKIEYDYNVQVQFEHEGAIIYGWSIKSVDVYDLETGQFTSLDWSKWTDKEFRDHVENRVDQWITENHEFSEELLESHANADESARDDADDHRTHAFIDER